MGTAAPFLNPIAAELEGPGPKPTAAAMDLSRRVKQRRQIQAMIAASYLVDGLILLLYAHAGTIPLAIAPAFAACGFLSVAFYLLLSETGFTERFKDHYFVAPQLFISVAIMLAFTYIAPEVGVMFLCTLFTRFQFRLAALDAVAIRRALDGDDGRACRAVPPHRQADRPAASATRWSGFAAMLMFALTIGRCMFLGIFSSSMRYSLYQSGQKLKEAYRRIEELAELDELTGAFNRRCIMRVLDEEISRGQRMGSPCSIALIDLDFFKRINDAFGHPTGDEVLRTFAITMFANIRTIDRFGRYGGEEFLLVLPDTTEQSAARLLDRLRAHRRRARLERVLAGHAGHDFRRASRRCAPNETSDNFLARADSALYASKARGRNRITSA